MPKAVIFDVDGTLVDSVDQHAKAWRKAFQAFGHEFDFQAIRSQIGKGGDQLMPVFLPPDVLERQGKDKPRAGGKTGVACPTLGCVLARLAARQGGGRSAAEGVRYGVAPGSLGIFRK